MDEITAGWYPDPDDNGLSERWWDGQEWWETSRPVLAAARRELPSNAAASGVRGQPAARRWPSDRPSAPPPPVAVPAEAAQSWIVRQKVLTALAVVLLIVTATVVLARSGSKSTGSSSSSDSQLARSPAGRALSPLPEANQHPSDVKITSCGPDAATGFVAAQVTVTNSSRRPSDYAITIVFYSKSTLRQIDAAPLAVDVLDPGQSSRQTAATVTKAPTAGYSCKVADALRLTS